MIETNCKGCNAKYICVYIKYSETCPCPTCIVKMVCNTLCDQFEDFKTQAMDRMFKSRYKD